jgi:predicted nucleic acid-binding protein
MNILLDSNILIRSAQLSNSMHQTAVQAVKNLKGRGDELFIVPQSLYEFWVVATRPIANNGLGMSLNQSAAELVRIRNFFQFLPETTATYNEWEKLVLQYQVMGKPSHDARYAAVMNTYGLTQILTFNFSDFRRFVHITAIDPHAVS